MKRPEVRFPVDEDKMAQVAEIAGTKRNVSKALGRGDTYYYKILNDGAKEAEIKIIEALFGINVKAERHTATKSDNDAYFEQIISLLNDIKDIHMRLLDCWDNKNEER